MAALGSVTALIAQAASTAVQEVRIESNLTPPIVVPQPLAGGQATDGDGSSSSGTPLFLRLLAPKVTVQLAGGNPIVFAPGGEPLGTWPVGAAAALVVLGLAVYGAVCLVRG